MRKASILLFGLIAFSLTLIQTQAEILNRVEQDNGIIALSLHTDQGYMDAFEATIDVTGDVNIKDFEWNNSLNSMAVRKMSISENKKSLHLLVASKATNMVEQSKVISLGNLKVEASKSSDYSVNLTDFSLSNLDMENVGAKDLIQQGQSSFTYKVNNENIPDDNPNENEQQPPSIDDDNDEQQDNNEENNPNDNTNSEPNPDSSTSPTIPDESKNDNNEPENTPSVNNEGPSSSGNSNVSGNPSNNQNTNVNSGVVGSGIASTWQEENTNYTIIEDNENPTTTEIEDDKEEKEDNSKDNNTLDKKDKNEQNSSASQEESKFKINQKFILGILAVIGIIIIMIVLKIRKSYDY